MCFADWRSRCGQPSHPHHANTTPRHSLAATTTGDKKETEPPANGAHPPQTMFKSAPMCAVHSAAACRTQKTAKWCRRNHDESQQQDAHGAKSLNSRVAVQKKPANCRHRRDPSSNPSPSLPGPHQHLLLYLRTTLKHRTQTATKLRQSAHHRGSPAKATTSKTTTLGTKNSYDTPPYIRPRRRHKKQAFSPLGENASRCPAELPSPAR